MLKKIISTLLLLCIFAFCFTSCGTPVTNYVHMNVEGYGDIYIELYPDIAPITVENFKKLVSEKFYDGLTFHRIMKGFMIQGGASSTKEAATIKGEFALNRVKNDLKHERGVISMARADDPNSASSQFFIMHATSTSLDGRYAAFGRVISGMDTVDKIAETETTYNFYSGEKSVPTSTVKINFVRFVKLENIPV